MPSYKKISQEGNVILFEAICDDGYSEQLKYICISGETEAQMMSRVAYHLQNERIKLQPKAGVSADVPLASKAVAALPQSGLLSV